MRRFVLAAMMFGAASGAHAADMPDFLRGSFSGADRRLRSTGRAFTSAARAATARPTELHRSTRTRAAALLANTSIEPADRYRTGRWARQGSAHGNGYGAFAGYNWQWDDVVVGVEANYIHGKFGGLRDRHHASRSSSIPTAIFGTTSPIGEHDVDCDLGHGHVPRARAATLSAAFLPYVFGGFALGNADIVTTAGITGRLRSTQLPAPIHNIA